MNPSTLSDDELYPLIEARHSDPFKILGIREARGSQFGRVFRPDAAEVTIVDAGDAARRFPLTKIHPDGLFESALQGVDRPFDYLLEMKSHSGDAWREKDAYSFGPVLGEMDIYLFNEGTHYEIYKKLGAHIINHGGVSGTHFAVWAPNAQRVSVVGDFNHWDGRVHCMRKMIPSGIWEIFIPEVGEGAHYKIEIRGPHGDTFLKTDPFAFFAQHGTQTGCMVFDINRYGWADADWMEQRRQHDQLNSPMSSGVHLGSWRRMPEDGNRYLSYIELGGLIPYVKELGFAHIESR